MQTGVAVNVSLLHNDDDDEIQEEYQDDFEEDDEDVEEGMRSFRRKINVNVTLIRKVYFYTSIRTRKRKKLKY